MKIDGSGCTGMVATCAGTSDINFCTGSHAGICYKSGTDCLTSGLAAGSCSSVTGTNFTPSYCKGISNGACSVNAL